MYVRLLPKGAEHVPLSIIKISLLISGLIRIKFGAYITWTQKRKKPAG